MLYQLSYTRKLLTFNGLHLFCLSPRKHKPFQFTLHNTAPAAASKPFRLGNELTATAQETEYSSLSEMVRDL